MFERTGLDDHVVTTIRFADGAVGLVESAWTLPGPLSPTGRCRRRGARPATTASTCSAMPACCRTTWGCAASNWSPFDEVHGFRAAGLRHQPVVHGRVGGALAAQTGHFLAVVRGETVPVAGLEDARRAIALTEAAERSLAVGAPAVPAGLIRAGPSMALYEGPIVDAHHHLWRFGPANVPLAGRGRGGEMLARDALPARYRAALAPHRPVATVWIEALATDPEAEAASAQAWVDADPTICTAIVAGGPLDAPDVELDSTVWRRRRPTLRGIRDIVSWRPGRPSFAPRGDLLADPAFERGLRALARRDLVFDLMALPHQLAEAARLLARVPGLSVAVEHAGSPEDGRRRDTPPGAPAWPTWPRSTGAWSSSPPFRPSTRRETLTALPARSTVSPTSSDRTGWPSAPTSRCTTGIARPPMPSMSSAGMWRQPRRRNRRPCFTDTACRTYRIDGAARPTS